MFISVSELTGRHLVWGDSSAPFFEQKAMIRSFCRRNGFRLLKIRREKWGGSVVGVFE